MNPRILTIALTCLLTASTAYGQYRGDRKLKFGDDAPKLEIEKWVKGDEVELTKGRVYVVEFWATWCGPCRVSIPHLTELQDYYGDKLTIIGVSDEEAATVRMFVARMGEDMNYTVAIDRNESTNNNFRKAADIEYIPSAFIIDNELRVAWYGNPLDKTFDIILDLVVKGRYDFKLMQKALPRLEAFEKHRKLNDWRMALSFLDEIIELDSHIFNTVSIAKFETMLIDMKDPDRAIQFARDKLMDTYANDPETLSLMALRMLINPDVRKSDPRLVPFSLEVAKACYAAAGDAEPDAHYTLALALYHNGHVEEAIAHQSKAYFLAEPRRKAEMKRALDVYQGSARIR